MLMEELRVAREKNLALEEKLKREERAAILAQERMVSLEEKSRELANRLKLRVGTESTTGPPT
jgi:hypothetical protein